MNLMFNTMTLGTTPFRVDFKEQCNCYGLKVLQHKNDTACMFLRKHLN